MINFLNETQTPTYIFSMQVEQDFSSLKQFFASLPLAKRSNSTSEVIGEPTRAKQQKRECPYGLISKSMITETIF